MNILVCIKQVPNTDNIKMDPVKGTMIREGVESIINPEDKNAIEGALSIREMIGSGDVTVLTMGPPQARIALIEAMAMGADRAVILTDRKFAGSDTWATSNVLAHAVRKLGSFDLIICGSQAIDGDTGQVGPQLAGQLDLPQITYVRGIKGISGNRIIAIRETDSGEETVESVFPVLLTVTSRMNEPRLPTISGINRVFTNEILEFTAEDINISSEESGLLGSPTKVKKTFAPEMKTQGIELKGSPQQKVDKLIEKLQVLNVF